MTNARRVMQFEAGFRAQVAAGVEPDGLRHHTTDEDERFWAHVLRGGEHAYWDGPIRFTLNSGKDQLPKRFVWERRHGRLLNNVTVVSTCGQDRCVRLEHLAVQRSVGRIYRDDQIIGAGQVAAMRLGHAPSSTWWERMKMKPAKTTIKKRFGSWSKFLAACGLRDE